MSSAAVVIGTLRVKLFIHFRCMVWGDYSDLGVPVFVSLLQQGLLLKEFTGNSFRITAPNVVGIHLQRLHKLSPLVKWQWKFDYVLFASTKVENSMTYIILTSTQTEHTSKKIDHYSLILGESANTLFFYSYRIIKAFTLCNVVFPHCSRAVRKSGKLQCTA